MVGVVVICCICEFFFLYFIFSINVQTSSLTCLLLLKKKGEQMELLGRMRKFGDTVYDDQIMQLT